MEFRFVLKSSRQRQHSAVATVMKELVKNKYKHLVHPEHPRALDYDTQQPGFRAQYPGGGGYAAWAFHVGYTRALLQAALDS